MNAIMAVDKPLGAAAVLSAATDIYLAFAELARLLRQQPGIRQAAHPCHLSRRPATDDDPGGFSIAWYADAVHESGLSVDFILELTYADDEWLIETSVRGGLDGDDVLYELPDRTAVTDEELVEELSGATRMLMASREAAMDVFTRDYVGRFT
jgi:hypothetical protein